MKSISDLTDAELMALAPGPKAPVTKPLSEMSDEELGALRPSGIKGLAESVGRAIGSPAGEPLRAVANEAVRATKEQAGATAESFKKAFTNEPPQPGEGSGAYLARSAAAIPSRAYQFAKGVVQAPGVLAAPLLGPATAAVGYPLAAAEHGIGKLIAPDIANKETIGDVYERGRGDVATALSLGKPALKATGGTFAAERPAPSKADIKAAAEGDYKVARNMGAELDSQAFGNLARTIKSQIQGPDIGITSRRAPDTFAALSDLEAAPPGSKVTIENVHALRQELRDIASDPMAGSDRKAAGHALDQLEQYMANPPAKDVIAGDPTAAWKLTRQADANYQASKLADLLDKKQFRSELRAHAANSGMNLANTIRQRIADILLNPKELRGFSADERKLMESIVHGTPTENSIRAISNVLGGGGGLGSAVTSGMGAFAGAMTAGLPGAAAGAMAPVVGAGMKLLSNRMALNRVGQLNEMVRARSPLAQTPIVSNAQAAAPYISGPIGQRAAIARALLGGQAP